jgi:DNA-binding response OmpR family regulator
MVKLLLVEDDDVLGFIIKEGMGLIGDYEVLWSRNAAEALNSFETFNPDVIISDIEMPGMNGLDFARKIREIDKTIPIVLETCVSSSKIILEAYSIGIDNYIKKPFLPEELHAYIQGLIKRIGVQALPEKEECIIHLGNIEFNTKKQALSTPEGYIHLSMRESSLLELLYKNLNQLVTKETIAELIWGGMKYFTPQRLDVFIYSIRKYLSSDSHVQIKTLRGIGYLMSIE